MIIDDAAIVAELERAGTTHDALFIREIFAKARKLRGIDSAEALALLQVTTPELVHELYETARFVKNEIYGNRLVLFAPLYISNLCGNECLYCAFRRSNRLIVRKALSQEEIARETEVLLAQGHKRVLMVAGEAYPEEGLAYIFRSIETIYSVSTPKGTVRRVNVNIAPLTVAEFRELGRHRIGTFQLFQETYHRETYKKLHPAGIKADYDFRIEAIDRAFQGGLNDLGIGILFGLHDWRYEILALLQHIAHLEKNFGVGPHTISVPRLEPAVGSGVSMHPPYPVADDDFRKIIAVLRIAVPYTGIILSTRESAAMRRDAFELGVSQISAGSRTNPGGYTEIVHETGEQFSLGDTRPLMAVIQDIVEHNHIPSFCTGCYRLGRVGKDFMDMAKPGLIKQHCLPNAMFTFAEYLHDFADSELQEKGFGLIQRMLQKDIATDRLRRVTRKNLERIASGERDIYL
jgi:2-iminoacetate synthase